MTSRARSSVAGAGHLTIDRAVARDRIGSEIDELSGSRYTSSESAICRYAYTSAYRETVRWFWARFEELGFDVWEDAVGTLVAQNRASGTPVFGLGSHCDSNRNGGRWDGTLGVVVALEVCRLARTHGLDLPLRVISFLEEEGSGFGQTLLGSRICAQRVQEEDLRSTFTAIDDGRPFWEHAREAGYHPEQWRQSARVLDDLTGWIECHIEQGRVLQDAGRKLGLVEGIAGYVHGDVEIIGRADHAGSTPMGMRVDALAVAAEIALELERLALAAGHGTVASVGELDVSPGFINVIPGNVRMSIDIRGTEEDLYRQIAADIARFALAAADRRGGEATFTVRQTVSPVRMSDVILQALEAAAADSVGSYLRMISGAAHDTVCVADRAPAAMLFVPCRDGISHSPHEDADPADAALACEVILNAVAWLSETGGHRA